MNEPRFIVVEGLDGVGKSTIARGLATALGATSLSTPHEAVRAVRPVLEDVYEEHPLARMLWYASTVAAVSDLVRAALAGGRRVICDRYWLSTAVYAERRRSPCVLDEVARDLHPADVTIYLHARPDVRRDRIERRVVNSAEDRVTFQPAVESWLDERFRRHAAHPIAGRFLSVDTSDLPPAALVESILDRLGSASPA